MLRQMMLRLRKQSGMPARELALVAGVACRLRTRYSKVAEKRQAPARSKRELRNHAQLAWRAEAKLLQDVLGAATSGGILVIPRLLREFERRLGKPVALSTIYRMLARHGWRKLAPDTEHPQGDPQARVEWKKNSPARWQKF